MERARQQGKRIGSPSVTEREGFPQRFVAVLERLEQGRISRRQAASDLAIGYATLKRLLDMRGHLPIADKGRLSQSQPAEMKMTMMISWHLY